MKTTIAVACFLSVLAFALGSGTAHRIKTSDDSLVSYVICPEGVVAAPSVNAPPPPKPYCIHIKP